MPPKRKPLVPIVVSFAVGIAAAYHFDAPFFLTLAICGGLVLAESLLLFLRRWRAFQTVLIYATCVAAGALSLSLRNVGNQRMPLPFRSVPAEYVGLIADEPQVLPSAYAKGKAAATEAALETRFLLRPDPQPRAEIQVIVQRASVASLSYGTRVRVRGLLRAYREARNPGQFDYRDYLRRRGIWAYLLVPDCDSIEILSRDEGSAFWRGIYRAKSALRNKIYSMFGQANGSLLACLILGDRSRIDQETEKAFINTGTVHLLVISGFHVGTLAGAVWLLLRLLRVGRRASALVVIVTVFLYAALTGMLPPAARAAIMIGAFMGGIAAGRESDRFNNLALAALIILAFDPYELVAPGFQLSFSAVATMLLVGPHLVSFMRRPSPFPSLEATTGRRVLQVAGVYLRKSFAYSAAAWLGTAPIVSHHFHIVTPGSVVANVLLMPLVSVLIGAGFLVAAMSLLVPGLAGLVALPVGALLVR